LPLGWVTPVTEGNILECRDLRLSFGGIHAVDGLNLAIKAGKITALIGPNGAGKSTTLGMIAGALKPTSGSILFKGTDITGWESHRLARIGLVRTFQLSSEFQRLTVLENMLVGAQHQLGESLWACLFKRGHWLPQEAGNYARACELLRRFDIYHQRDEYAGNLSGGQKRLLELARALMANAEMLLLDEPMAGVNPALADRLIEHLRELNRQGLTCLIVEHELGIVERLSDTVVVMAQGRLLAEGSMREIREDAQVVEAYLS